MNNDTFSVNCVSRETDKLFRKQLPKLRVRHHFSHQNAARTQPAKECPGQGSPCDAFWAPKSGSRGPRPFTHDTYLYTCLSIHLHTYMVPRKQTTNTISTMKMHRHTQVQTCCNTSDFHTFASFPGLSWIGLPMPGIPRRMLLMLWEVGSSLTKHTFGATGKYHKTFNLFQHPLPETARHEKSFVHFSF